MQVHIFVLGRHLGFGTSGGLEQEKICQGSSRKVKKWARGREGRGRTGHSAMALDMESSELTNKPPHLYI